MSIVHSTELCVICNSATFLIFFEVCHFISIKENIVDCATKCFTAGEMQIQRLPCHDLQPLLILYGPFRKFYLVLEMATLMTADCLVDGVLLFWWGATILSCQVWWDHLESGSNALKPITPASTYHKESVNRFLMWCSHSHHDRSVGETTNCNNDVLL